MDDNRDHCLNDDEVQALASGALSSDIASHRLAHLGRCEICRPLVAAIARTHTAPPESEGHRAAAMVGPVAVAPGTTIDRYVVEQRLGQGGMGVVYAAYDPQLDRRIALKLVRADRVRSPELRERLVREARIMASVSDAHVLAVYDAGVVDEQVFIAMELIEGTTLRAWLHGEHRSWSSIVDKFVLAGRGLAAAHSLGIVHRDFKPDNVLVSHGGQVRVCDLGLAMRAVAPTDSSIDPGHELGPSNGRMTEDGQLLGTPAYMAPEQRRGETIDARTDQFSFCVALMEALNDPASRSRGPAAVRRAILRGMSASPSARFPSMESLLEAIERGARSRRRRIVGFTAILCLATGGLWGGWRQVRAADVPVTVSSVRRLTFTPGCEEYPSFIGDGGAIVFDGTVKGSQQLFTLEVASGAVRQLTEAPGSNRAPLVSPDGRRVAYEHQGEGPRELRLRSFERATDDRSLGNGSTLGASWLSSWRMAVIGGGGVFFDLAVDTRNAQRSPLFARAALPRFGLSDAFADGTLAVSWWNPPSTTGVGLLATSGLRVLVDRLPYTDGALRVSPSDDAIYFVRRTGAANELVRQPRNGDSLVVVGGGIAPARGFAISPDGTKLVFSTCASRAQIVRIDDQAGMTTPFGAGPWSDTAPAPLDTSRLLFASERSGHAQLYVANTLAAAAPHAITGLDVEEGAPSADGRWIVYAAHDPGGVWLAPVDTSEPARRLTDGAHDEAPQLSADGGTVYFVRDDAIFAIPRAGGAPHLVAKPGQEPVPSRVTDRLYFLQRNAALGVQRVMSVGPDHDVATVATLPAGNSWALTVSTDGTTLAVVHEGFEILEMPSSGGQPRLRARLAHWISSMHYAFEGRELWASVEELDGDLWIASGRFR